MKESLLRDIKGPLPPGLSIGIYSILFFLFLLAAAIFVFWFIRRKKGKSEILIPEEPPHVVAYKRLEALRRKDLFGQGKIKEYYIEISWIIRQYLEVRFNLRAPEMTTEEFLASLKVSQRLNSAQKELLKEFLGFCDLVKFARHLPEREDADAIFSSAEKFIN